MLGLFFTLEMILGPLRLLNLYYDPDYTWRAESWKIAY